MNERKYIKDYIDYSQFQYAMSFMFLSYMEGDKKRKKDATRSYYSTYPIQKFNDTDDFKTNNEIEDKQLKKLGWKKEIIDTDENKINFLPPK